MDQQLGHVKLYNWQHHKTNNMCRYKTLQNIEQQQKNTNQSIEPPCFGAEKKPGYFSGSHVIQASKKKLSLNVLRDFSDETTRIQWVDVYNFKKKLRI